MSAAPKHCHYFTLWIKRSSCIKTHNVITLTTARKSDGNINCSIRLVNERFKDRSYCKNTMSELKAVLQMTTAHPDTCWKTATPLTHSCTQQWWRDTAWPSRFWCCCDVWGRQDQWCVFCIPSLLHKICITIFIYLFYIWCSARCSQPELNLVNLEATVAAKWTLMFLFSGTPR